MEQEVYQNMGAQRDCLTGPISKTISKIIEYLGKEKQESLALNIPLIDVLAQGAKDVVYSNKPGKDYNSIFEAMKK